MTGNNVHSFPNKNRMRIVCNPFSMAIPLSVLFPIPDTGRNGWDGYLNETIALYPGLGMKQHIHLLVVYHMQSLTAITAT